MKIVIDIPKRIYDMTIATGEVIDADNEYVALAIKNGEPLPEPYAERRTDDSR